MEFELIVVAGLGLFLAGIIKGVTGLGYTSCALPFLVLAIGLKSAMAVVLIPAFATNIGVAVSTGYFAATLRRFRLLYLAMIPGILGGTTMLVWVPQAAATKLLGLVIVSYAIFALAAPQLRLTPSLELPLQVPTGVVNGVMTGLTGAQVMPLFPYMMALDLTPAHMTQAINIAVLLSSVVLGAGLALSGILDGRLLVGSIVATVPALIGVSLGTKARQYLPPQRYRVIALATLGLVGSLMALR